MSDYNHGQREALDDFGLSRAAGVVKAAAEVKKKVQGTLKRKLDQIGWKEQPTPPAKLGT